MAAIAFTTDNLIALNKLESSVRYELGKRHSLSEEQSLFNLLQIAAQSSSKKVQSALTGFLLSLSAEQKGILSSNGMDKHLVQSAGGETNPASENNSVSAKRSASRTYRGVAIKTSTAASSESVTPSKVKSQKATKMYRGRAVL